MVHVQSGRLYTGRLRGSLCLQLGRGLSGQVCATHPLFIFTQGQCVDVDARGKLFNIHLLDARRPSYVNSMPIFYL